MDEGGNQRRRSSATSRVSASGANGPTVGASRLVRPVEWKNSFDQTVAKSECQMTARNSAAVDVALEERRSVARGANPWTTRLNERQKQLRKSSRPSRSTQSSFFNVRL